MKHETEFKIGDRVVWHTTIEYGEQGQRYPSTWAMDKMGKVVKLRKNEVLIQFRDGGRTWAEKFEVEHATPS